MTDQQLFCPKCGRPVEADAAFCRSCGAALTAPTTADATPVAKAIPAAAVPVTAGEQYLAKEFRPNGSGGRWFIGIAVAIAVIVGVAYLAGTFTVRPDGRGGTTASLNLNDRLEGCDAGVAQIRAIAGRWDEEEKVASQTPRIALAAQISRMQQVRREEAAIAAPKCVGGATFAYAVTTLGMAMDVELERYVDFLGQGHTDFSQKIDNANKNFVGAMTSLTNDIAAARK